jgi:hypothetical protein
MPICARLVVIASLTACYGSAPPPPTKIPLPSLVDGEEIRVTSQDITKIEQVTHEAKSCNEATPDPQHCTKTTYTEAEPVTRTHTTASYGGQPINYAQLRVLGDPQYDAKLAQLEELSHVCRRANIPRYVGLAAILGGIVVAQIGSSPKNSNYPVEFAGFAAIAGGITSYAIGYYTMGGRECREARALYEELEVGNKTWSDVIGSGYAEEMKALAEKFNAARGRRAGLGMR